MVSARVGAFICVFTQKQGYFPNFATHFAFRCQDAVLSPGYRIAAGETKPCSEIGKSRTYAQKIAKGGTAMVLYRKAYKTHFARIRSGTMTREQFDAWKDEATAKRLDVETGILDMDEYATRLKK